MPHFMTVLILYINLLNLSWIIKCLFLKNMEPLKQTKKKNSLCHKLGQSAFLLLSATVISQRETNLKLRLFYVFSQISVAELIN